VHFTGVLLGQELIDAYHSFSVFTFASKSETQGMVLTEAMAADVPVVALDASGVRDAVTTGKNGIRVMNEDETEYADAISQIHDLSDEEYASRVRGARETAYEFSRDTTTQKALAIYKNLIDSKGGYSQKSENPWKETQRRLQKEWNLLNNVASATGDMMNEFTK
jgi:glycosyltransferase involved in cell wall biosynthesis